MRVTDDSPIELTEKVVDEFVDEVPMAVKLERFRKNKKRVVGNSVNNKKINNSGKKGLRIERMRRVLGARMQGVPTSDARGK